MFSRAEKVLALARSQVPDGGSLANHIDMAAQSATNDNKRLKLFRTTDDFPEGSNVPTYDEVEAFSMTPMLSITNCHNGQRKLTMSVLEFLAESLLKSKADQKDVLVLYVGASGMATVVAAHLFEHLQFVMYDPAPNTVELMPPSAATRVVYRHDIAPSAPDLSRRIIVFTDRAGWFSDSSIQYVKEVLLPASGRSTLFFVSDIRADTGEDNISDDMIRQARWAMQLGSHAYMFKFRLPYKDRDTIIRRYREAFLQGGSGGSGAKHPRSASVRKIAVHAQAAQATALMPYLDGKVYIQLYGRTRTAETRLIGFCGPNATYRVREYDICDIENKLAIFNIVHRSYARFSYGSVARFLMDRGHLPCAYELVAEYYIMERCARAVGKNTKDEKKRFLDLTDKYINHFITNKDILVCPFVSARAQLPKLIRSQKPAQTAMIKAHMRDCLTGAAEVASRSGNAQALHHINDLLRKPL